MYEPPGADNDDYWYWLITDSNLLSCPLWLCSCHHFIPKAVTTAFQAHLPGDLQDLFTYNNSSSVQLESPGRVCDGRSGQRSKVSS